MRKIFSGWLMLLLVMCMVISLAGCCSAQKTAAEQNGQQEASAEAADTVDGLPQGFPKEISFYDDAEVIEADCFSGNNYTVMYKTTAEYEDVLSFYTDAFELDGSGDGDNIAYYEGIELEDIMIKGLTIEAAGDGVNVYMVMQDNGQDPEMEDASADEGAGSGIMTYEAADEVALDDSYPEDTLPLPSDAKVIGCSMVPGICAGFVDLILPADNFDATVTFYTDTLGVEPKITTTTVQEGASFAAEVDNLKISLLVSHLLSSGNDTFVQITIDEK